MPIVNGGFEAGDTTGWRHDIMPSDVFVVTSYQNKAGTIYEPKEGNYFLLAGNDRQQHFTQEQYLVCQTFNMDAGDVLSGWVAFDWISAIKPHNPSHSDFIYAELKITPPGVWTSPINNIVLKSNFLNDNIPWTRWSFNAPFSGDYDLMVAVNSNFGDTCFVLLDAVKQSNNPPAPPSGLESKHKKYLR